MFRMMSAALALSALAAPAMAEGDAAAGAPSPSARTETGGIHPATPSTNSQALGAARHLQLLRYGDAADG